MASVSNKASQILHSALVTVVFKLLDLLDAIFCVFYSFLDEFLEGAPSRCYCGTNKRSGHDRDNALSETLYGRQNAFREMGVAKLRRKLEESGRKVGNLRLNRWSDCGCDSCLSWRKKDCDQLSLHFVVKEPLNKDGQAVEDVVFIHGFLSSSSYWTETVFKNLSESGSRNYRLFALDLLGFGKSPKPRECLYTLEDHLETIEKSVISPHELKSFHLVAHSMGCVIALALAAKHPESINSLTLVAPPCFPASGDDEASLSVLRNLVGKKLWPPLLMGAAVMSWYEHLGRTVCFIVCRNHRLWEGLLSLITGKREVHYMVVDLTRHTHHSAWHCAHNVIYKGATLVGGYLGILRKYGVKVSVMQGEQDQVVPLDCSIYIKQKAPEADVRIIANADHSTVITSRAKEFTRDLEGIWKRGKVNESVIEKEMRKIK